MVTLIDFVGQEKAQGPLQERKLEPWLDKITCMDALEGLKQLPRGGADLVLTDPPFNALSNWGQKEGNATTRLDPAKWFKGDNLPPEEFREFSFNWLCESKEILKNTGSLFTFCDWKAYPVFYGCIVDNKYKLGDLLVWYKNSIGLGWIWRKTFELIIFVTKTDKPAVYDIGKPNTLIFDKIMDNNRKHHPTEKPISLIEALITTCTDIGDIVLDPFMGSGTTAVACRRLRRRFIGFEINPEYCKIAEKRLRKTFPLPLESLRSKQSELKLED